MKELLALELWANKVIANEAVQDRPLARSQDIQYQASRQFPDRSPEQALQLFVANKMADNDKMNLDQNKLINAQKRENEKLRRSLQDLGNELHDHERTAMDTEREVTRLKQLSAKLGPAGQEQQLATKASADKVQQMLNDLESLKNKPGIDDKKFKELSDKVEVLKSKPVDDSEIEKIQVALNTMNQQQSVDDELFNKVMQRLENTEQELSNKEQRFRKSLAKNAEKIGSWGNKFKDLDDKIKEIENATGDMENKTKEAKKATKQLAIIEPHIKDLIARLGTIQGQPAPRMAQSTLAAQGAPSLADYEKQDELERSYSMATNVNEDIRMDDPNYKKWLRLNVPVALRLLYKKFPHLAKTYSEDQIIDQITDNMIYLYSLPEITPKIMNDFLELISMNLEEEGPDQQPSLFSESLVTKYERMLDNVIGLPKLFKKQ